MSSTKLHSYSLPCKLRLNQCMHVYMCMFVCVYFCSTMEQYEPFSIFHPSFSGYFDFFSHPSVRLHVHRVYVCVCVCLFFLLFICQCECGFMHLYAYGEWYIIVCQIFTYRHIDVYLFLKGSNLHVINAHNNSKTASLMNTDTH